MQLKITLAGNRIQLPMASSSIIQGFIYDKMAHDPSFSYNLHERGYTFGGRKFKLFSFGELKGNYEVDEKQMIYKDRVTLEVRSSDPYMIQLLYTSFISKNTVQLGDNTVRVENLELNNKVIFSDSVKVKTLSPITVYTATDDGHTVYFSPDEERFYEAIVDNAKRKWSSCPVQMSCFDFMVTPSENTSFVKRATNFKGTFITAWHGEFYLRGNSETLTFLYNTGIGSKNSQGFGMFEVIG